MGKRWNEKRVKELTGEDPITARFLYRDNFTFRPQATFILMGNHAPEIRNLDEAMRRRIRVVPFKHPPAVKDELLFEKLRAEWPGILRWAIEGAVKWCRDGLAEPECVRRETEAYFDEEDNVGRWRQECTEDDPSAFATTAELFASYRAWAERGKVFAGNDQRLSRELSKRGFEKTRAHGGVRGFRGIRLRTHEFPAADPSAFAGVASATEVSAVPS